MNQLIYIALIWFILIGCSAPKLEPDSYKKWIVGNKTELERTKTFGHYTVTARYIPQGEMALRSNEEITSQILEGYSNVEFFNIKITNDVGEDMLKHGLKGEQDYYDRMAYYMNSVREDCVLEIDGVKIKAADVHLEQTYGIEGSISLSAMFSEVPVGKDIKLIYDENVFNMGRMKFLFTQKELDKLPLLIAKTN